jgi:hypothetical protein
MLVCTICADPLPQHHPCHRAHADICHDCYERSMHGGSESEPHPAPRETPVSLTAAVRRVLGTVPEVHYPWLEEDAP